VGQKGLHVAVDDRDLSHDAYLDLNMITKTHTAVDQAEEVIHTGKRPIYRLQVEGAHSGTAKKRGDSYTNLHLTGDHKVRTTRGMVPAQDLEAGDEVHVIGGGTAKVRHCTPRGGQQDVYDVVNTSTHTFIANGIVVSNCGEQMLPPNSVCNLAHINLARFIREGAEQLPLQEATSQEAVANFDVEKFTKTVQAGIRFLDNITDLNHYHDPAIESCQKSERRIGLGVLGYGELLVRLGLRYGSEEALKFTSWLFETFSELSYLASSQLAEERGPFAKFDKTKFLNSGFMKQHTPTVREAVEEKGIRNVTINTVAPTGSVGTMLGTTTGIEPYFLAEWIARSRIGSADEEANILAELHQKFGDDMPSYFVTTRTITPEEHVKTQGTIQRWIDSSISKTINLPNSATKEDVARSYELLYSEGCKGGTVYRDGSRPKQVLYYKDDTKKAKTTQETAVIPVEVVDEYKQNGMGILRPKITKGLGVINSKETPVGLVHGVIRMHPVTGKPYDVFLVSGKGDVSADVQAVGRLISTILRWPDGEVIPQELRLEMIRDQLHRIPGRGQVGFGPDKVISLPDGIAQILNDYLSGEFPMPNIPLGENQLDDFLSQLTKDLDADQKSMHDWIVNEGAEAEEDIAQFEEPDSMGFDFDICPKCGNATYVHIPNKCPYCVSCMHTDC
jgi:ribonucleoside-diphosphate reductase alpha chain